MSQSARMHPARTLTQLREPDVRLRWLATWLREGDPVEVVATLEESARHAAQGDARLLHLTFVHLMIILRPRPELPGGPLPPPDRRLVLPDMVVVRLIQAAMHAHLRWTTWLLRECFRRPTLHEGRLLQLHPTVEKVPLGVRKERARIPDPELVSALLVDTTPAVVQILGENARLSEAHALTIATLRPTHPYALQALLMNLKWLTNVRVVESLVRNDAAPGWLVLALAPLLPRLTQKALVNLPRIDMDVREILADWVEMEDVVLEHARRQRDPGLGVYDVADEELAVPGEWEEGD